MALEFDESRPNETEVGGNTQNTKGSTGADTSKQTGGNLNLNEGLLIIGNVISGNVEQHYQRMQESLKDKGINVTAITQNLDFPLIVYSMIQNRVLYYYVTIVTDETKKGPSIANFLGSLKNKDAAILYAPDAKFTDEADDAKLRATLKQRFPDAENAYKVGVSVVNYNSSTYGSIENYVTKLIQAGPYLNNNIDQTKDFAKENINIRYNKIEGGMVQTETGQNIRADFSLGLNIPKANSSGSKNELNMDYVTVYGYIDLLITKEAMLPLPGQMLMQPLEVNKVSPTIVITYIKGVSALPGYGMLGIITATTMTGADMYFGYILENIAKYQDFYSVFLGQPVDFSKMSKEEKIDILQSNMAAPALCIDIPNNGYMEELSFLVDRRSRELEFKTAATRFLKEEFKSTMISGDVPLPLTEVFNKNHMVDGRVIDAVNIASKSKDKSWVIGMGTATNNVSQIENPNSIGNVLLILNDAGLDGTINGTVARIFLNQQGLVELYQKSGISATYNSLYTPDNTGNLGIISRAGLSGVSFHNAHQNYNDTANILRKYNAY